MENSHRVSRPTKLVAFLLIILTLYMATFPIILAGQEEVRVDGRIIDEDEEELDDVKVEVYSSKGALITSEDTDSDGEFRLYLEENDTYTLHFSKSGFAKATKSIYLSDEDIDLEDIVLLKALRLSSPVLSRVASPGDKLMLPFTVSNIGEEPEEVELSVSKPEDWSTRILDETGEVTEVYLSTGTSLSLQLEAKIPLTSIGKNSLSLTAEGKTETTLKFKITVEPSNESIISCQFPGKSTAPGYTIQFQMRLKNPFGDEMVFRVGVDSIPLDWKASVESTVGEAVTEVTLDSSEFVDLIVKVTPPITAKIGKYEIVVKAESSDGNVTTFLPLNVTLTAAEEEEIQVAATFLEVTAEAGKVVRYPITIINSGETDRTVLLSVVENPTDWKVAFKSETDSSTVEVSGLYLTARARENLVFEVTPPSTANIGSYAIPVQVESEDGAIRIRLELKATITGSYVLNLEPSTLYTDATVGGSTTFTTRITNTGQTPVTNLMINIDAPEEWKTSVTPVQVESLKPLESTTFTIVVETPDDTVAGDYLLTLMGLSDQVESDEVQVRVTATAPTSWGLIGIGIAAVVVVVLIVVFKKFRRR